MIQNKKFDRSSVQNAPVNGDVQTKQVDKVLVFAESEQVRKIPGIVLVRVDSGDFALAVDVTEDASGDGGKFGDAGVDWLRQ